MNFPELTPTDFLPLYPALILTLGAVLLTLSEVFLRTPTRGYQSVVAAVTAGLAGLVAFRISQEPAQAVFGGMGVLDPFSAILTSVVCLGLGLTVLIA
ncbi:MAG TPA: NADH-quinone oxidoreductase subunit N, partial [Myxococcaceae bacterium]|nr:NADH-quinone oxidoreductase subunit N [Myxococcaceae bacterium]